MKQLTTYNRAASYLNKLFNLLNQRFFESELTMPTITIQSTPKAYGHFTLRDDTWVSAAGATNEINIGAGTLARPIENVCATLLHEMCHYYCHLHGVKDTSRSGTYHNRRFKETAEGHGLTVEHSEKYGWTVTSPSEALLDFVLENGLTDPQRVLRRRCGRYRHPQRQSCPARTQAEFQPEVPVPLLRQLRPGHQGRQSPLPRLWEGDGAGVIRASVVSFKGQSQTGSIPKQHEGAPCRRRNQSSPAAVHPQRPHSSLRHSRCAETASA